MDEEILKKAFDSGWYTVLNNVMPGRVGDPLPKDEAFQIFLERLKNE